MKAKEIPIYELWDSVVSERTPVFNSYDNKKVKDWSSDDFVSFVKDHCDLDLRLCNHDSFISQNDWFKDMCSNIPAVYPYIYLYGVWQMVRAKLRVEYNNHVIKSNTTVGHETI